MAEVNKNNGSVDVVTAYTKIPYSLINQEVGVLSKNLIDELTEICKYYDVYKKGSSFLTEGSHGDYVPANLRFKLAASLINKESRFLFAESPDVLVQAQGDIKTLNEDEKNKLIKIQEYVKKVLDYNNFEDILLKASKDCFIGKRVAGVVNFNSEDGVTITFLPSTQFIYETKIGNPNILTKFIAFIVVQEARSLSDKRILKKKYTVENNKVYLEENLYDGSGKLIEELFSKAPILLSNIPAVIILNDGLTGDLNGESEVELLDGYEEWYSKLSNADMDAERKSMNPIRYTVDMESNSTKNLSSSAGSFWDLQSDQNLDKPVPSVGMLETTMGYSESLKTSLDRIKTAGYEQVDVPNISLESMKGSITTGKALKAIYWPLIVRCKEKMKSWAPQLRKLVKFIVDGGLLYPDCIKLHTDGIEEVPYEVEVVQNLPLPEDETEEKTMDLSEIQSNTMSKKSYMKKWRGLNDEEVEEELLQMARERQLLEESSFEPETTIDQ